MLLYVADHMMLLLQIVLVPIIKKETDREEVMAAIEKLHAAAQQAGLRCKLDASTDKTPGWKFNHYEMKVSQLAMLCMSTEKVSQIAGRLRVSTGL